MKPRRTLASTRRTHLLILILVISLVSMVTRFVRLGQEWHSLNAIGHLEAGYNKALLHHLPRRGGQSALLVSLVKPGGGSHNRTWELRISKDDKWQPDETIGLEPSEMPSPGLDDLAAFRVIHRNDQLFDLDNPGFWYRRKPRGYQFLVQQNWDTDTRDHGCEPDYYTWVEGDTWRHSDRWGRLGEPANYHAACDLADNKS